MSWDLEFGEPVRLPGGGELTTLRDAADLIQKLSEADAALPKWQTAIEALIMAAELRGPVLHAKWGMTQALHGRTDYVTKPIVKKDLRWGRRKLVRER